MSGAFNLTFLHGVPAVDSWEALFKTQNIVRNLPQNEFDEANRVIHGDENERYNVTIRWHESHYPKCPYLCGPAAQIVVPQAPARTMHVDWDTPDAPCLPGSAPVRDMPEMAAVNKIVGPLAPPSPPPRPPPKAPPQKPKSDQPSTSSSACADPHEKAVETHRGDTEQATVTTAALCRLFTDVTMGVPDWTDFRAARPLLPSRASQKRDYENLKSLREKQARYVLLLMTTKETYFDAATEFDMAATTQVIRQESHKLSLLDSRLEIYATVLHHVTEVAFNEIRLATDHTSKNEPNVKRAIVTFKQAKMLVDAVSLDEIHKNKKLIVDISTMRPWNKSLQCYLMLDVFRSGTMEVEKRRFRTQYVQIKYFEASWPGALVAHRIQPLHGSMHAHTKQSPR